MARAHNLTVPARRGVLGTQLDVALAAIASLSPRLLLRGVFASVIVAAMAMEAVRFGVVERPMRALTTYQNADPVVASVGTEVLRVSDAYAHAAFVGHDRPADLQTLISSGTVSEAADHLALAQAAREAGIADSVEVRASVALAEREILAEAFLDRVAQDAVTEEAILARYRQESLALARDSVMRLYQIVLPTREAAESVVARLPRADFTALARQRSIDEGSREKGGYLGEVRADDLHPRLAEAAAELTIGGVSEPVETEAGWHVLKLESRRAVRLPPLAERREAIAAALKREAIEEALAELRSRMPLEVRDPGTVAMDMAETRGTIAALGPRE